MKLYARSDLNVVAVGPTGHVHERPKVRAFGRGDDVFEKVWALDCPACEQYLLSDGWAKHPDKVELTPDEREIAEAEEKTGNAMVAQMARALAENAANAVRDLGASARHS